VAPGRRAVGGGTRDLVIFSKGRFKMEKLMRLIVAMHARATDARERGATATEYALLVALIALVIIVGVTAFGSNLNDFFQGIADTVAGW
jgi:pilus assembly protein Flp/PilA